MTKQTSCLKDPQREQDICSAKYAKAHSFTCLGKKENKKSFFCSVLSEGNRTEEVDFWELSLHFQINLIQPKRIQIVPFVVSFYICFWLPEKRSETQGIWFSFNQCYYVKYSCLFILLCIQLLSR